MCYKMQKVIDLDDYIIGIDHALGQDTTIKAYIRKDRDGNFIIEIKDV